MGKPPPRPGKGRPPNRRGGAGTGPRGPVKTGSTGRGTNHKGSSSATAPQLIIAFALIGAPIMVLAAVVGYLAHGYGLL